MAGRNILQGPVLEKRPDRRCFVVGLGVEIDRKEVLTDRYEGYPSGT
jgi:hypothetical protein